MRRNLRGFLSIGLALLCTVCVANGWSSPWKSNKQSTAAKGGDRPAAAEPLGGAMFELEREGGKTEEDGLSKTFLMKQAHSKAMSSPEATCWQKAYAKLLTSCSHILQDEEKKSRLAFEFADCFLLMTGWPPPRPCPDSSLVRFCTEKFDEHTHEVYLAFFVETAAMCHHLQSEAFRKETRDVVNDLKQTGHQVLHKVKEVKGLSQDIIDNALEQSQRLQEKLAGVETLSQSLLMQGEHFETQLEGTLSTVQAVYDVSGNIKMQQEELQQLQRDMHQAINTDMQELQKAAVQTNQELHSTAEGYKKLAQQQVELAVSLVENVQRLKDSALQSLSELKDSQTFAMEETRVSFADLNDGAQKAQASFHNLRTKMDDTNNLLLKSSHAILQAQETFVAKQGSILSTLDRMFSLYDSLLYESKALKMVIFYGTALLFVHVLSSAKQTNNARAYLYFGLCFSLAMELYIMKAYGSMLQNQQWIQVRSRWIRAVFVVFTSTVVLYCMATYRDLSSQNHKLLLQLHGKLSDLANQSYKAPYYLDDGPNAAKAHADDNHDPGPFSLQFTATAKSLSQALASKILHRVHKFVRRRRARKNPKHDALRVWMEGHGLDTSSLQQTDDSSLEDDDDPDYQCSKPYTDNMSLNNYNLRSSCSESAMCYYHRRRFR